MISALLYTPVFLCVLGVVFAVSVLAKLFKKCRIEEITPEWLESFSASSYYPMERLLAEDDFAFLSRQPGFDLSLYRKLRRERLHIFRQYLRRLVIDFNRLHLATRVLVAHGSEDRSELLTKLILLKFRFSIALIRAEASYVLCCCGLRSLAARGLILQLEAMNAQLSAVSVAQAA